MKIEVRVTINNERREIEAVYFKINWLPIKETVELDSETYIDISKEGKIVGIEMLSPGKVTLEQLKKVAKKYKEPVINEIRPKRFLNLLDVLPPPFSRQQKGYSKLVLANTI
jgi:uncharacterized protein YuzE